MVKRRSFIGVPKARFANRMQSDSARRSMSAFPWFDLGVLIGLVILNGVFAMSELAIVSARTPRLRVMAERGSKGAQTALDLAADPGKFLSTVQIGITLVGIVAGAYSGATLGGPVGERLVLLGMPERLAEEAGFVVVIALTTYGSLVVGELVPKQYALQKAEAIATLVSRPMRFISIVAAPLVWLLDNSSRGALRMLGIKPSDDSAMTTEELHMIFADATRTGVIEEQERAILSGIMRLNSRPVRELMTPRIELDWIDLNASQDEIREEIENSPHSRMLVADGTPDKVLGIVRVRDILAVLLLGQEVKLQELVLKAEVLPDQLDAMDALRIVQQSGTGMAMVHDEYGALEGIVTPADLLSAIAGGFASYQDDGDEPQVAVREDGSLLIAGSLAADTLADRLPIELPDQREFATAAGYVLWMLKHLPQEGEWFIDQGWRFEVVDMDGRKIDKILASRQD